MKKIIVVYWLPLQLSPFPKRRRSLNAKTGNHEMKRKHHRGDEFKNLNLSEEQKTKLKALHEENRKQMEELKKNDNITVKEWNSRKWKPNAKNKRRSFKAILTADQKAQISKIKTGKQCKS